ncbi:hypothetical protein CYMTET_52483, partial [Cymbomonas tetramitiformis]
GGVVFVEEQGKVEFIDCLFRSNSAVGNLVDTTVMYNGGGVAYLEKGTIIFRNCKIEDSVTAFNGGVIYAATSVVEVYESVLRNNTCKLGGGVVYAAIS